MSRVEFVCSLYTSSADFINLSDTFLQRTLSVCRTRFSFAHPCGERAPCAGAAHGLCSILLVLLQFPWFVGADPSVERDLRASVDFFLHVQTPKGNFPCDLDDVTRPRRSQDELVHWCHGAPGELAFFLLPACPTKV